MICPICGKKIKGYPALSRRSDVEICEQCGIREALEDWYNNKEVEDETNNSK